MHILHGWGGGVESSRLLCMYLIYGFCLLFPIIMHKCETMHGDLYKGICAGTIENRPTKQDFNAE